MPNDLPVDVDLLKDKYVPGNFILTNYLYSWDVKVT